MEKRLGKILETKQMKDVTGEKEIKIQELTVPPKILVLTFETEFLSDT